MAAIPRASETAGWVLRAGLIHRTGALVVSLLPSLGLLGPAAVGVTVVAAVLLAANVPMIAAAYRRADRLPRPLRFLAADRLPYPIRFLAADLVVVVAVNLWLAWELPAGTLAQPPGQVFHLYTLGTVVVWTALLGWRAGTAVVAVLAALYWVMALVNGLEFSASNLTTLAGRVAMLAAAILVPQLVVRLAKRARLLTLDEAQRWAAERARAKELRTIHDTVLQTFGQLARLCSKTELSPRQRCREVSQAAEAEYTALTRRPRPPAEGPACPVAELRFIAEEYLPRGLRVSVTVAELPQLDPAEFEALTDAVREALTNTVRHAGVGTATVLAEAVQGGVAVTVTDSGHGFNATSTSENFGLRSSIRSRIAEAGGTVGIDAAVGRGTRVRLWVPGCRTGRRLGRDRRGTRPGATDEELANRALGWFVVPALVYRFVIRVILAAIAFAGLGTELSRVFMVAMAAVVGVDLVILLCALLKRFLSLLRSKVFLGVDVVTAATVNLWSASVLPVGMILEPHKQVFWGYAIALVAFWTAMRGFMLGAVLVLGGVLAQVGMVLANGSTWTVHGVLGAAGQVGLLALTLAVVGVMTTHARRDTRGVIEFGMQAGRKIAQSQSLRLAQESAIRALERIRFVSGSCTDADEDRLQEIRGLAMVQSDRLRSTLNSDPEDEGPRFQAELLALKQEYLERGLRVELVTAGVDGAEPPAVRRRGIIDVVRGALERVHGQDGVGHVVVHASIADDTVEVVIRDQGPGIDAEAGQELHHVLSRYLHVDEELRVWSQPDRGCRVTVRSPLTGPVAPRR